MLFDMTAGSNSRKIMALDPNFPKDVSLIVNAGNTTKATFGVSIADQGRPDEYFYQWYVNGNPVEGATKEAFTKDGLSETEVLTIFCEVTNKAGTVRSREANLKVTKFEVDSNYPQDVTLVVHDAVTSNVVIPDELKSVPCTYQWYKNDIAVDGATSPEYTFTPDTIGTSKLYCIVTNEVGSITSRTATITANPYYIYKEGDTGGWSGYGAAIFDESEGNVPSISYSGKRLTINESVSGGNSRGYALKNKSDKLSKFSKIYFEIDAFYNPGYEITANIIQGHYWNDGYHYGWSTHASRSLAANGLLSLDISTLSGDYQLQILLYSAVNQGNGQISFKNIYCV